MVNKSIPMVSLIPILSSETKDIKLKDMETGRRKHSLSLGSGQFRDSAFNLHRLEPVLPSGS
mgnify:FL=1